MSTQELSVMEDFERPPMKSLRGGFDDDTEPEEKEDLDDDELDVEQNNVQILSGRNKETIKDPEEEENKKKKRRRLAFGLIILLAIIGGVVGFLFGYSPDEGSTARAESERNATKSPTESPTEMTASPTASPTLFPQPSTSTPTTSTFAPSISTPSPTFSTDLPLSSLTCEQLIVSEQLQEFPQGIPFKENYTMPDGRELCSDTYVGFPNSLTRNPWTAKVGQKDCWTYNYTAGTDICESVGARRCTADELQFGAGQGSGCGGDDFLLYSGTDCETESGDVGFYTVNLALKNNATFYECQTDLSVETLVRCCGDHEVNYS